MLKIKNLWVAFCLVCLALGTTQAQTNDRFQAIENEKVAFITKELNLSSAEAQQFFPVYNEYNKALWSLRSAKVDKSPNTAKGFSSRGHTDVIAYDAKEVELKKEYRAKFSKIIGNSRASEFFEIEQDFREKLYKELQTRRNKR